MTDPFWSAVALPLLIAVGTPVIALVLARRYRTASDPHEIAQAKWTTWTFLVVSVGQVFVQHAELVRHHAESAAWIAGIGGGALTIVAFVAMLDAQRKRGAEPS